MPPAIMKVDKFNEPLPANQTRDVVMIPGLLCDEYLWSEQARALEDRGFTCISFDVSVNATIEAMASEMLAQAPPRFHLIGLSMGGYVSLAAVRKEPNRIASLGLLGTSASPDTQRQSEWRQLLTSRTKHGDFGSVVDELLPMMLATSATPELVENVRSMFLRVGPEVFQRQQRAIMLRADARPSLPEIQVPTVVVCGKQDGLIGVERSEELSMLIPGSRIELLDGCGHLSTLEQPEGVSEILLQTLELPVTE